MPSTKAIVAAEEAFKKGEVMMSPNIKRLSEYSILFACFLCYCLIVLNISKMLHSGSLLFFSVCIVLTVFYMGLLLGWIITEKLCFCAGGKRPLFVKSYLQK